MKDELAAVIDELLAGNLPPERRFEKLYAADNLYSVRRNQACRFVFLLDSNRRTALPVAVGPHDEAYRQALRSVRRR